MLKKVMKYDLRASWRICAPLLLASGIVAVVCCALMYFTISLSDLESMIAAMLTVMGFYVIGVVAILILAIVAYFAVFVRYYRSMFTDEGYLTMVLPVKTSILFGAKVLSALVMNVIICAAAIASFLLAVAAPMMLSDISEFSQIWRSLSSMLTSIGIGSTESVAIAVSIINVIVSFVEGIIIVMSSITIGSVLIGRYKIVGSIGIYLAVSFVHSLIMTVCESMFYSYAISSLNIFVLSSAIRTVLAVAFSALLYFISLRALKYKLNI